MQWRRKGVRQLHHFEWEESLVVPTAIGLRMVSSSVCCEYKRVLMKLQSSDRGRTGVGESFVCYVKEQRYEHERCYNAAEHL